MLLNFDNTISVKNLAKSTIITEKKGNEIKLYNVGQIVSGEGFVFLEGEIIECYEENGYYYYVVKYKLKQRSKKYFTKTIKQSEIKTI